ncbi:MAG: tetratricopeptide repeat protein [Actinomycetota bacterium]
MNKIITGLAATVAGIGVIVGGALLPGRGDAGTGTAALRDPDTARALSPVASNRDLDATIATLESQVAGDRASAETHASLGLAYLNKARATAEPSWYTRAEDALTRSLETDDSENFTAFVGMGVLQGARHDFTGSLNWARRAQEVNPFNSFAYGIEGDALIQLGRANQADAAFQEMIDRRPDLGSFARIAYARQVRGDTKGAIEAMESARQTAASPEDFAWTSYHLAELYVGSGRLKRAEKEYGRGAAADPQHHLPDEGFAHLAFTRGDYPEAIRLLSSVIDRVPLPDYMIALGDLYLLADEPDLAEAQYRRAEEKLAGFHAAGVNPDTEEALFYADDLRDPARALEISTRLMEDRSTNFEVLDAHAWALHATGRRVAAEKFIRRALAGSAWDPGVLFHAGAIADSLGKPRLALERYEAAVDADPYFSFRYSHVAQKRLRALSGGNR